MTNTLQNRRSLSYLLLPVALAVCVCLQIIMAAVRPEGLLAVLASLFHIPGYISYPYNISTQVTLLSSPTTLYAGMIPNSFVLRANDGAVAQRLPQRLFAVYNDIIYTDSSSSNSQNGVTQVRALRENDGKELWSHSFEHLDDDQLLDGILYFNQHSPDLQRGLLQAFDATSGRLLWQYQCPQECDVNMPRIQQGIVYLVVQGTSYRDLLALRTSDGRLLWQVSQYTYALQPLFATNHLLVQTSMNTLTAYGTTDGRVLWQVHVVVGEGVNTLDAISNGAIDLISSSNTLYAFNAENGALLWQRPDSPLDMHMNDTTIYLSEPAGLVALSATSGQQLWQQIYPSWAIKPAQSRNSGQANRILGESNGMVYMLLKGPQNGNSLDGLFAFNATDGQLSWQRLFALPTMPEMSTSTGGQAYVAGSDMEALLADNTIYFTGYQAITTIAYFHMTLSVYQTLNSFFNMTTFTLTSEALDGQTGSVKWQNQQVEQFHVA